MVLTLYADRRTPTVVAVAHHLTEALSHTNQTGVVELYFDDALSRLPEARALSPAPRLLPDNVRALLPRFAGDEIAVVVLRSPVREQVITAFDLSARILVVADTSVPSLRAAQRVLRLCADIGYPVHKTEVVISRVDKPGDADCESVRSALRRDVSCVGPVLPETGEGRADYVALAARVARP